MRPLLADAISILFRSDCTLQLLGSVSEVDELPRGVESSIRADVMVFDGRQRGSALGGLIRWWKHRYPRSHAIAIDLDGTEPLVDWIACGLDGFVSAQAQLGEICDTIADAVHGQVRCSPALVSDVVARIQTLSSGGQGFAPHPELTLRETQILQLLAENLSNKEIAARLDISVYTVKNHVHNLLEKMRVHYRRQAIRFGLEKGLLQPGTAMASPTRVLRISADR